MVNIFGVDLPDDTIGIPSEYFYGGLGAAMILGVLPLGNKNKGMAQIVGAIVLAAGGLFYASKRGIIPGAQASFTEAHYY